jgi:hypothetical protein
MDRFIKWIMKTRAWEFILRSINKIDFKISGAKPLFDMSDYHDIKNKLSINHTEYSLYTFATSDVSSLISTSIRKITNGNYNHAGIILYNKLSGMAKAFHITTQGLREEDLLEVLRDTDYISINKIDLNTEDK